MSLQKFCKTQLANHPCLGFTLILFIIFKDELYHFFHQRRQIYLASSSVSVSYIYIHESRVQSRSKNAKKWRLNLKKNPAEAVRKYISLYNKQSPDFKDKSKRSRVLSQDDLCERIHFSFLVLVLSLLFFFVVVK